jgi:hypothetical protein
VRGALPSRGDLIVQLEQPRIQDVLPQGGERRDWERIFDEAVGYRHDAAVLRVLEGWALRKQYAGRRMPGLIRRPGVRGTVSGLSLAAQFRALFRENIGGVPGDSDVWWDGNFVAVDGGSGKLHSWVDYIDNAHLLTQSTGSNQSVLPSADAGMGGALTAAILKSATVRYQSNKSNAFWGILNSGLGCTYTMVYKPLSLVGATFLFATTNSGTAPGAFSYFNTTDIRHSVGKTGGTPIPDGSGGSAAVGIASYLSMVHATAATPQFVFYRKGTAIRSVAYTVPTAVEPANFPLVIGALTAAGANSADMALRAVYCLRRAGNSSELATMRNFIQQDTGVSP